MVKIEGNNKKHYVAPVVETLTVKYETGLLAASENTEMSGRGFIDGGMVGGGWDDDDE